MSVEAAVEAIWDAASRGVYYPSQWRGKLSMDDAYRVQLGILARHVAAGERQAGWKVGLTARAMQIQQRVHEPVFGVLLESGNRPSGTVFRFDELIQPGFENELCLTIGATLRGPGVTVDAARAAITAAAPALEIIERRGDFAADLPLALADNAQQKAFVTGPPASATGLDLAEVTLAVAEALGLRPLAARVHLGLGILGRLAGRAEEAQLHLRAGTSQARDLGMDLWIERVESEVEAATPRS